MYILLAIVLAVVAVVLFKVGHNLDSEGRSAIIPMFFGLVFMFSALQSVAVSFGTSFFA